MAVWMGRLARGRRKYDSNATTTVEDGFTIVEMTVALGVIMVIMVSLASVMTGAVTNIGFARQRQVANGLLDQTMEQVRALPFATVANGLDDTDVANSHDTAITIAGSQDLFTNGETIPHGNLGYTQSPLNPHVSTSVQNGTTYSVRTYPTNYGTTAGAYRVTVIVSWTPSLRPTSPSTVTGQTVVASPAGCISSATHPFGAPCQPFLYSAAGVATGFIRVRPAAGATGAVVGGIPLTEAVVFLTGIDATEQIEQVSTASSRATTTQAVLDVAGSTLQSAGQMTTSVKADNDPGSTPNPVNSGTVSQSGGTLTATDAANPRASTITVATSPGDSGTAVATAVATLADGCNDLNATALLTGAPCASGVAQQSGATSLTASMNVAAGPTSLGSTLLGSVTAAPTASRSFVSRHLAGGGSYCASASGDGCVHGGVSRSVGTVNIAGLPLQFLTDGAYPPGWGLGSNNRLFQLSNYGDQAVVESGVNPAAPSAVQVPATGSSGPTLTYWNGAGYSARTVNWGAAPPTITIPTVSISDHNLPGGDVTVTIATTFTTGAATTATTSPAGCNPACTATATVTSPVKANVVYTIAQAGNLLANIEIALDLGTITAQSSYRAAPSAG